MISAALAIVMVVFPLSEIALAVFKRAIPTQAVVEDRGSMRLLWAAVACGVIGAIAAQSFHRAGLPGPADVRRLVALALMVGGLTLRWVAIVTLGRFFTVDVAVQARQPVIQTGVYRFIRHPSYAGLLLAFVGLGVFFGSWLSLIVLLAPTVAAVAYRIMKEEAVLLAALGPPFAEYRARTKRLIPGLL